MNSGFALIFVSILILGSALLVQVCCQALPSHVEPEEIPNTACSFEDDACQWNLDATSEVTCKFENGSEGKSGQHWIKRSDGRSFLACYPGATRDTEEYGGKIMSLEVDVTQQRTLIILEYWRTRDAYLMVKYDGTPVWDMQRERDKTFQENEWSSLSAKLYKPSDYLLPSMLRQRVQVSLNVKFNNKHGILALSNLRMFWVDDDSDEDLEESGEDDGGGGIATITTESPVTDNNTTTDTGTTVASSSSTTDDPAIDHNTTDSDVTIQNTVTPQTASSDLDMTTETTTCNSSIDSDAMTESATMLQTTTDRNTTDSTTSQVITDPETTDESTATSHLSTHTNTISETTTMNHSVTCSGGFLPCTESSTTSKSPFTSSVLPSAYTESNITSTTTKDPNSSGFGSQDDNLSWAWIVTVIWAVPFALSAVGLALGFLCLDSNTISSCFKTRRLSRKSLPASGSSSSLIALESSCSSWYKAPDYP